MSIRAVFDANVLIAALISPAGPGGQLLDAIRTGDIELVICPQLLAELRDIVQRPKIRAYVTSDEAQRFVRDLTALADRQPDPPSPPAVSRDPNDDYLIALARAAGAVLVTGDHDLVSLDLDDLDILPPRIFLDDVAGG